MTYKNAVLSALKENPDINKAELAEQLGCSLQTVYRAAQKPAPKKPRNKRQAGHDLYQLFAEYDYRRLTVKQWLAELETS